MQLAHVQSSPSYPHGMEIMILFDYLGFVGSSKREFTFECMKEHETSRFLARVTVKLLRALPDVISILILRQPLSLPSCVTSSCYGDGQISRK